MVNPLASRSEIFDVSRQVLNALVGCLHDLVKGRFQFYKILAFRSEFSRNLGGKVGMLALALAKECDRSRAFLLDVGLDDLSNDLAFGEVIAD